jgi:hypothetical protein
MGCHSAIAGLQPEITKISGFLGINPRPCASAGDTHNPA